MNLIKEQIEESIRINREIIKQSTVIEKIANSIISSFKKNGKVFICGNGGSASDSQHIAAEFINKFRFDRTPLPAISLTSDTSVLTSISNDYDFENIFERQIKALGRENDILIALTTSGKSKNVINAVRMAKKIGMRTIVFTGDQGIQEKTDICLKIPSKETPRVQEAHILTLHIICDIVERKIFNKIK